MGYENGFEDEEVQISDENFESDTRPTGPLTDEYGVREAYLTESEEGNSLILTPEEAAALEEMEGKNRDDEPTRKVESPKITFTEDRRRRFLQLLAKYGIRYKCARAVGISPAVIQATQRRDPAFRDAVEEALKIYSDTVEEVVMDRALRGWTRPVFSQRLGTIIGTERVYSDKLMELVLKRHKPEYNPNQRVDVAISGGVLVAPAPTLSVEAWRQANLPADEKGSSIALPEASSEVSQRGED